MYVGGRGVLSVFVLLVYLGEEVYRVCVCMRESVYKRMCLYMLLVVYLGEEDLGRPLDVPRAVPSPLAVDPEW